MAFEITIPRLGWSMEEGTFAGWQKKDGDVIRRGDVLFELEGEKALQEIESIDEGILRIPPDGPKPGAVLKVGAVVGYLVGEAEPLPWNTSTPSSPPAASAMEAAAANENQEATPAASPSIRRLARKLHVSISDVVGTGPGGRITEADVNATAERRPATQEAASTAHSTTSATPRARRTAKRLGVEWNQLTGSGKGGRIRERDVLKAFEAASAPSIGGSQRIPVSGRRKVIAERLSESVRQTVPVTITTRADATNMVHLREQFKAAGQSPVPAIHDFVAKFVGDSLRQFPLLAGRWDGDSIVLPDPGEIHLGLAVDTPEGLIVPVIRNVATSTLVSIAGESARVIQKARSGRMSGAEMQGAVFTITNLGSFGIDAFTPVINLPETAILGLGAIRQEPVVLDDGQIVVRRMMTLSLTFDHRAIDGALAAKFLQSVSAAIARVAL